MFLCHRALLPFQLQAVANLTTAIQSGNLNAARAAYARARPPYEQFEVIVLAPLIPEQAQPLRNRMCRSWPARHSLVSSTR